MVFPVHMAQKRCSSKTMWLIEKYPPKKLKISIYNWNHRPILYLFPKFKKKNCALYKATCSLLDSNSHFPAAYSLLDSNSFLQLPCGSLRPVGKHSCSKAGQKGVKQFKHQMGHATTFLCLASLWSSKKENFVELELSCVCSL